MGTTMQVPPMVSAVKVGGRRLHQLARAGVEVERPARGIRVTRFDVGPIPNEPAGSERQAASGREGPVLLVRIDCSSGTYVRVLAADLGVALGGGAHVRRLRRTAVGPWTGEQAIPLDRSGSGITSSTGRRPALDGSGDRERGGGRRRGSREGAGSGVHRAAGPGPWSVVTLSGELLAVYQAVRLRPGEAGGRAQRSFFPVRRRLASVEMEVLHHPGNCCADQACAVTIGAYDGVHTGHRLVIDRVKRVASEQGLASAVVTFDLASGRRGPSRNRRRRC